MLNKKSKKDLYQESKEKIALTKDDKLKMKFAEMRHKRNSELFGLIKYVFKLPYICLYMLPKKLFKIITYTEKRKAQEKEIERLKLVVKSKEKAKAKMELGSSIPWDNKYLVKDGVFPVGFDINTEKLITIDFNVNANLLVGGMPGKGKTKLIQLIIFQCLKHGSNCYIGDFKGGVDTIRFANKAVVITEYTDLLNVLIQFRKEIKRRQKLFIDVGAENLQEYNELSGSNLKREYLFIDELGEALEIFDVPGLKENEVKQLRKDIENNLKSIARLGRAFGLNLVCGTQRPDCNILEGQTRDQFGGRVCFKALPNTSLIVLSSKVASDLPDIKGRAVIMIDTSYVEIQVFYWNKETISEIPNKKLKKNDLKVVTGSKNSKENTFSEKEIETIDIDLD